MKVQDYVHLSEIFLGIVLNWLLVKVGAVVDTLTIAMEADYLDASVYPSFIVTNLCYLSVLL